SSTIEPTPTPTPGKRTRTRPAPSPDDQVTTGYENPSILPAAQTSLTPLLGTQPEKQPTPEKPKEKPKKSTPPTPKPNPSIDDPAEPAAPPPTTPPPAAPEPIKPPPVVAPPPPPPAPSWPAYLPKGTMTAADFPDAVGTRRVHQITLLLIKSAFPPPRADGTPGKTAWPVRLALDPWPRYIAWASALVELIGGILVLAGFFTRLGAFMLSTVMLSAIWLTQIGPAIASGQTTLMILPTRTWWEPSQWAVPLWQLANLCMSLALVAAGPGWLALDKAFASGGGRGKKPHAEGGEE
ncbi:MAG: DoxX family protein, partial [bacterium]